jgi:hypothetical protein
MKKDQGSEKRKRPSADTIRPNLENQEVALAVLQRASVEGVLNPNIKRRLRRLVQTRRNVEKTIENPDRRRYSWHWSKVGDYRGTGR